ncbi:phage protein [Streptococcus pseudoporcinus]|uniref:Phage protein n=1 Tax=Streptococcus pseudoporcinus TaxID=361101 RepID=A0A4V6L5B5_9STRE|nr:phage protein [Streptococcus pseudoporcinus]
MTENIKEALQYAVNLANEKPQTILGQDGKEYFDRNKYSLAELRTKRRPKTLNLSTLNSLVDYLKSDLNSINKKRLMIVVENPTQIIVCEHDDEDLDRNVLVTVEAITPQVNFGRYEAASDFNIILQSKFVDSDDRPTVIEFASALKIENGSEIIDDGISQNCDNQTRCC